MTVLETLQSVKRNIDSAIKCALHDPELSNTLINWAMEDIDDLIYALEKNTGALDQIEQYTVKDKNEE